MPEEFKKRYGIDVGRILEDEDLLDAITMSPGLVLQIMADVEANLKGAMTGNQIQEVANSTLYDRCDYEGGKFRMATTRLFTTPSSREFAHGADMLLPIVHLAEEIMAPDEQTKMIERINWRSPVTHNMRLMVAKTNQRPFADNIKPAVDGYLKTSTGNSVYFAGVLDKSLPLTVHMPTPNPYVVKNVHTMSNVIRHVLPGEVILKTGSPLSDDWHDALTHNGFQAATLAELVTVAYQGAIKNLFRSDFGLKLMGGLTNLPLGDIEHVFNTYSNLQLRIDPAGIKLGRSGMTIVPFAYRFDNQNDFSRGFGAVTDSPELVEKICG